MVFRALRRVAASLVLLAGGAGAANLAPGARGYGLTVMSASRIDTFGVEILGVERNGALPGRDRILVRLSGLGLEESGIVLGMSGSPVYVDGELIGAVAYGWSFSREPVGLLTPIAEMREILQRDLSGAAEPDEPPAAAAGAGWRRLGAPLWVSGAGPATLRLLSDLLTPLGLEPVAGGAGASTAAAPPPLRPGSAIGVQLIGGDLSLTGIGTVTWVDGDRLVAFGHDMVGNGAIDMPLTAAHIHGILSNQSASFKLGAATAVVGAARQDRYSGVAGLTGARARTLPLAVEVHGGAAPRTFHFDLARHPFYTTSLAQVALMGSLESVAKAIGDACVTLRLQIRLEDGRDLTWERVHTGLSAPVHAAIEAGGPLQALLRPDFGDVRVERIDARIDVDESIRAARIGSARLSRPAVRAGSRLEVAVDLLPFRGTPRQLVVPLEIPADAAGELSVRIGSGRAAAAWEAARQGSGSPVDSDDLLRRLAEPARDDELVVELVAEVTGLAVDGRELPAPPPSVQRLLTAPHAAGHVRNLPARVVARSSVATGYVLEDELLLTVNIEAKGSR